MTDETARRSRASAGRAWRTSSSHVDGLRGFPDAILHMQVRKIAKNRGHFPNDDAARKLLYLALRNIAKKWTIMPHRCWRPAANQFTIMFGERFTRPDTGL